MAATTHTPQAAKAQAWFKGLRSSTSSTTGRVALEVQPAIDWDRATYSDDYVVAPFVDTANPFADAQRYGYRFLVVRIAADSSCTGRIAELLANGPVGAEQAAHQALAGTKPFLAGQTPGAVEGLTGYLLVYSPAYEYETGLAYQAGALQPLRMQLYMAGPTAPDTCENYNLIGIDLNSGDVIINEFAFLICTGGVPGAGGGWGGGGGSTTGGGGGSSSSTTGQPKTPCAALTQSGQNAQVQAQLNTLKGLLNDNKEYGVAITYGANGTPTFTTVTGQPGQLSIDPWNIP